MTAQFETLILRLQALGSLGILRYDHLVLNKVGCGLWLYSGTWQYRLFYKCIVFMSCVPALWGKQDCSRAHSALRT